MKVITVRQKILKANSQAARENRARFSRERVCVINILGSPGAGKTALLERIAGSNDLSMAVLEGDPETAMDAERMEKAGATVIQVVTRGTCHLDANMVQLALPRLDYRSRDFLFVENVGNLLCPASFDLGETMRWVVLSTAEGADKPFKYPAAFKTAKAVVINKIDLLPYLDFSMDQVEDGLAQICPKARVFKVSCKTGEGIDPLMVWLRGFSRNPAKRDSKS